MRSILAGLIVAFIIALIALLVTAFATFGVAAIGWLVHRWVGLNQWQGTLVALVMMIGLAFLVYRVAFQPPPPVTWVSEWDEEEEEEEVPEEPPVVPWRRSRPTPGELPVEQKSTQSKTKKRS